VCLANVSGVRLQGGVFFYDEVVGVVKIIVCAVFPFFYLNLTNSGIVEYMCREEVWPTRRGSRSLIKSGLCAGGLSWGARISSSKAAG
jgi:hypothetical protein